ncbi:unnamed protein product [Rotaria socialis]
MDQFEFSSIHNQHMQLTEDKPRSMFLSNDSHALVRDNQSTAESNSTKRSLMNTSLCKTYKQPDSSKQFNTCTQCYPDRLRSKPFRVISTERHSDNETARSTSFAIEKPSNIDKQKISINSDIEVIVESSDNKITTKSKNDSYTSLHNFGNRESSIDSTVSNSSIISQSSLYQLLLRPKVHIEENIVDNTKSTVSTTISISDIDPIPKSVPVSNSLRLSNEQINYYKKRETELNHSAKELIERLKIKTNDSINQISKYWFYLKQFSLDKLREKTNHNQLFYYLLKSFNLNKEFKNYLETNDEITAALQVLSTTLIIVRDNYSLAEIDQIFDKEEKKTIKNLRDEHEALLSSYYDELSIIHECSLVYQKCLNEGKDFHWTETINNDYPALIEKVSEGFINKAPQVEQVLLKMLSNVKKRLHNKMENYE